MKKREREIINKVFEGVSFEDFVKFMAGKITYEKIKKGEEK